MEKENRKRILIVNVNWLGDVLLSTASIKAIRKEYPESYIACMVVPRCKQILENNPHLDEIIIFDEDKKHRGLVGKLKFIVFLRKKHFDSVFLFHRSFTRLILCFLAGIPERIGYYRKKGGFLLTKKIKLPSIRIHRADYFLNLVKETGIKEADKNCEFFIGDDAREKTKKYLKDKSIRKGDFLVTIHPGGNWKLKRWPYEKFATVSDKLIETYNAKMMITGTKSDIKLAKKIKDKMKHNPIITSGQTNLEELAALLEFSDLVISGDTGPMHIAICMQTPVIALFGPTSRDITGPYTDKTPYEVIQKDAGCAIPCYDLDCQDNRCMKTITVKDVLKAIDRLRTYLPISKR